MIDNLHLWDRLTPHFSLTEFCHSTRFPELATPIEEVSPAIRERIRLLCEFVLEPLRHHLDDRPIIIHSGLRSPKLNEAVGGALTSHHLFRGFSGAVDFHVKGVAIKIVPDAILELNINFAYIIMYYTDDDKTKGFIHFSMPRSLDKDSRTHYKKVIHRKRS